MSARKRRYVYIRVGLTGAAILDRRKLRGERFLQALLDGVYIKFDTRLAPLVEGELKWYATLDKPGYYTLYIPSMIPGIKRIMVTDTYPVTPDDWRNLATTYRLIWTHGEVPRDVPRTGKPSQNPDRSHIIATY